MNKLSWKEKGNNLKANIHVLYLALKSNQVPWYSKVIIGFVVGYALSPIDLIPDFIPVLGYLDDMILLPIGIYLALKIIPSDILEDLRRNANSKFERKRSWITGIIIIFICFLIVSIIILKVIS